MGDATAILDWLAKGGPFALILLLLVFAFIWRLKYNHSLFFPASDETNEAKQRTDTARARRLEQIKAATWEKSYIGLLGRGIDFVARRLATDHEALEVSAGNSGWTGRLFGLNPFTEGSYQLTLRQALVYPLLSLFLV